MSTLSSISEFISVVVLLAVLHADVRTEFSSLRSSSSSYNPSSGSLLSVTSSIGSASKVSDDEDEADIASAVGVFIALTSIQCL
jgi:hypothetical protein